MRDQNKEEKRGREDERQQNRTKRAQKALSREGGVEGGGKEQAGLAVSRLTPAAWEPPARPSQLLASAETVLTTCSTLFPPSTLTQPSEHNSAAISSRKPSLTGLKLAQLPSRIPGF